MQVIGTSCDYVQPTIIPDYFNWVSVKVTLATRCQENIIGMHVASIAYSGLAFRVS